MRIPPIAIQPFAREHGKPASARGHAEANAASGSDTPAATRAPKPALESASSAKVQTQNETKTVPPGLERALSRLEPARNAGQARAYDRISSHIARYLETQALVPSSVTPSTTQPVPEAATATAPDTPAATVATVATDPVNANDVTPLIASASTEEPAINTSSATTPTDSTTG